MQRPQAFFLDYWLLLLTIILLSIGFLLLASASMSLSVKFHQHSFYFLTHQAVYLCLGVLCGCVVLRIPLAFWQAIGGYLLLTTIFLLILVLIPGIGRQVNGSIRWIGIGPLAFQVSEFAKFAVIVYNAGYLLRRQAELRVGFWGFVKALVLVALIASLLLLEPDFGAIVVMVLTTMGMMYLAGARLSQFVILLLLVMVILTILVFISPYRLARLTAFLDPWSKPFDSGYQLIQSLIAFGRGGWTGVGLGNSVQKLFYLPEAHTDFLFAVLAEELGIVGQVVVLSLFSLLISRILRLGMLAAHLKQNFASHLAYGLGLLLALQVIINIGVNLGLLPTKGLTLPFMSYGGSSMLFNCIIIATVLRIYHEVKLNGIGLRTAEYFIPHTKRLKMPVRN